MISYIYLVLILLSILLLLKGLHWCYKYSPKKIKVLSTAVYIALLIRYVTLLILFLAQSSLYLYCLKPLYNLDIALLPSAIMLCYYIFSRNNKINFNMVFVFSVFFIILYVINIVWIPSKLILNNTLFYTFHNEKPMEFLAVYLLVNLLVIIFSIKLLNNNISNKIGVYMMSVASIVTVFEIFIYFFKINILPENILGDLLWVITLNYSMLRLKKKTYKF